MGLAEPEASVKEMRRKGRTWSGSSVGRASVRR